MIFNGFWLVFLCGAFGGFLGELLKWYRLRHKKKLPQYLYSPFYWGVTILIIVSGGLLTVLYGIKDVNALMAVNIGLTSPLIIQSLSNTYKRTGTKIKPSSKFDERENIDKLDEYLGFDEEPNIWTFLAG